MPVGRLAPLVKTVAGADIVYIIDIKTLMRCGIIGKCRVQPVYEIHSASSVNRITVAHKSEIRLFKVILYNGAVVALGYLFPHCFKIFHLLGKKSVCLLLAVGYRRIFQNIAVGRVNENKVGREAVKLLISEYCVLPVTVVLRLVEGRLDAVVQQE